MLNMHYSLSFHSLAARKRLLAYDVLGQHPSSHLQGRGHAESAGNCRHPESKVMRSEVVAVAALSRLIPHYRHPSHHPQAPQSVLVCVPGLQLAPLCAESTNLYWQRWGSFAGPSQLGPSVFLPQIADFIDFIADLGFWAKVKWSTHPSCTGGEIPRGAKRPFSVSAMRSQLPSARLRRHLCPLLLVACCS